MLNSYAKYRRNLSDMFNEPARDVFLAMERRPGLILIRNWLEKELHDKELFYCVMMCEVFQKCEQEVNETGNQFVDKLERCYKLMVANIVKAHIPKAVRACMAIRRARITDTQRMLITIRINLNEEEKVFCMMRKELQAMQGEVRH